jgi:hypothetical protein
MLLPIDDDASSLSGIAAFEIQGLLRFLEECCGEEADSASSLSSNAARFEDGIFLQIAVSSIQSH